jgi:hypothetical protein
MNCALQRNGARNFRRWSPVDRVSHCIQHAPYKRCAHLYLRSLAQRSNLIAKPNSIDIFKGHGKHIGALEPDDFRKMMTARPVNNLAALTH